MYLAWYDASKKLSNYEKIHNAFARYVDKFDGAEPTELLVNSELDQLDQEWFPGQMDVYYRDDIPANCFWIGTPEDNT